MNSEEMSVHLKLEASKRKLHEGYQQAENGKKLVFLEPVLIVSSYLSMGSS